MVKIFLTDKYKYDKIKLLKGKKQVMDYMLKK